MPGPRIRGRFDPAAPDQPEYRGRRIDLSRSKIHEGEHFFADRVPEEAREFLSVSFGGVELLSRLGSHGIALAAIFVPGLFFRGFYLFGDPVLSGSRSLSGWFLHLKNSRATSGNMA